MNKEIEVFGTTVEAMQAALDEGLQMYTHQQLVVSILSDAQEEMALGLQERARQSLNRAKWILSKSREV